MKEKYAAHLPFVDGVVFDFGGVMSHFPKADWPIYPMCEQVGLSREAVKRGLDDHRHEYDAGFIDCEELYKKILRDNNLPDPPQQWFREMYLADSRGWRRPDEATLGLMRECKAAGKKIGILTNMSVPFFNDYFVPVFGCFRELADAEVVSGFVHLYKPQREIYDLMSERIGLPPEKLLFLDDLESNINAARSLGWRGEVFTGA